MQYGPSVKTFLLVLLTALTMTLVLGGCQNMFSANDSPTAAADPITDGDAASDSDDEIPATVEDLVAQLESAPDEIISFEDGDSAESVGTSFELPAFTEDGVAIEWSVDSPYITLELVDSDGSVVGSVASNSWGRRFWRAIVTNPIVDTAVTLVAKIATETYEAVVEIAITLNPYAKRSITFSANHSEASGSMDAIHVQKNTGTTLPSSSFGTPMFHRFLGWSTSADGDTAYAAGDTYTMGTDDVTLYAVWGPARPTVAPPAAPAMSQGYGWSVAADGDYAIVGNTQFMDNNLVATILHRENGVWTTQQDISLGDLADPVNFNGEPYSRNSYLYATVSISGARAVIGLQRADAGDVTSGGRAWVLEREGTSWATAYELDYTPTNNFTSFGSSVSLDGDFLVVGAPGIDDAMFFDLRQPNPSPQSLVDTLVDDADKPSRGFGNKVAVDDTTIIVASEDEFAYSFAITDTGDSATVGTPTRMDGFGESQWRPEVTSIALDGTTAVITSAVEPLDTSVSSSETGAAYVYTGSGATGWSEPLTLRASNPEHRDQRFGWSVALHGDRLAIAGYGNKWTAESRKSDLRAVYLFTRNGMNWTEDHIITEDPEIVNGADGFITYHDALAMGSDYLLVGGGGSTVDGKTTAGTLYTYR